jgi:hypothetical protein
MISSGGGTSQGMAAFRGRRRKEQAPAGLRACLLQKSPAPAALRYFAEDKRTNVVCSP